MLLWHGMAMSNFQRSHICFHLVYLVNSAFLYLWYRMGKYMILMSLWCKRENVSIKYHRRKFPKSLLSLDILQDTFSSIFFCSCCLVFVVVIANMTFWWNCHIKESLGKFGPVVKFAAALKNHWRMSISTKHACANAWNRESSPLTVRSKFSTRGSGLWVEAYAQSAFYWWRRNKRWFF